MTARRCLPFLGLLIFLPSDAVPQQAAPQRNHVDVMDAATERAITNGLRALAKQQRKDGSFDDVNPVGVTSLAMMAYMMRGHFPEKGEYGEQMSKAVDYLIGAARNGNGYMGKSLYDHGLAMLALSEVWGESTRTDEIRDALKKAVLVLVNSQLPSTNTRVGGGWRYYPDGGDADVSATVLQIMGMISAREAGIVVPDTVLKRAAAYVKSCQQGNGSFTYQNGTEPNFRPSLLNRPEFARSAAGVMSLMMCGDRNSNEARRGIAYLKSLGNQVFNPNYKWFYYGHYYAIQVMYQAGENDFVNWYRPVRHSLLGCQHSDGSWGGGFNGQPLNMHTFIKMNPDAYCTPMAILILGVPYHYLPIYQR